jgi:hypothetical protein
MSNFELPKLSSDPAPLNPSPPESGAPSSGPRPASEFNDPESVMMWRDKGDKKVEAEPPQVAPEEPCECKAKIENLQSQLNEFRNNYFVTQSDFYAFRQSTHRNTDRINERLETYQTHVNKYIEKNSKTTKSLLVMCLVGFASIIFSKLVR